MQLRNFAGNYVRTASSWRKMAAVAWSAPDDPTIYGTLDVDFGAGRDLLRRLNAAGDVRVTVTHLVVRAVAETLRRHPECNGLVRRNRIFERAAIDVSVLVAVDAEAGRDQQADLSSTIVRDADRRSLVEIARLVSSGARGIRAHHDPFLQNTKRMFELLPPALVKRALHLAAKLEYGWNVSLRPLGIPRDPFGSLLVTNIGTFGLHQAYAPIPPFSGVPLLIAVGGVEERAVVRDGAVVARPILPLHATIDHRLIDGYQAAKLGATLRGILEAPASLA